MPSAVLHEALAPLRSNPAGSAVLLDIDGTLSPIVENAADASVPEATRKLLIAISRRYGLVACVSGRRASQARAMVSIGSITYLGSHGAELLESGWTEAVLDPAVQQWAARAEEFRAQSDTAELRRAKVRIEDKGPIVAFHWRGAADEGAARDAIDALAAQAQEAGFEVHWGRKVMEARPPLPIDKGAGIATLLERHPAVTTALYGGDDTTDLDAFRTLKQLAEGGRLDRAVCVGVSSEDGPAEIEESADLVVAGTLGMQSLLAALLPE